MSLNLLRGHTGNAFEIETDNGILSRSQNRLVTGIGTAPRRKTNLKGGISGGVIIISTITQMVLWLCRQMYFVPPSFECLRRCSPVKEKTPQQYEKRMFLLLTELCMVELKYRAVRKGEVGVLLDSELGTAMDLKLSTHPKY